MRDGRRSWAVGYARNKHAPVVVLFCVLLRTECSSQRWYYFVLVYIMIESILWRFDLRVFLKIDAKERKLRWFRFLVAASLSIQYRLWSSVESIFNSALTLFKYIFCSHTLCPQEEAHAHAVPAAWCVLQNRNDRRRLLQKRSWQYCSCSFLLPSLLGPVRTSLKRRAPSTWHLLTFRLFSRKKMPTFNSAFNLIIFSYIARREVEI